MANASIVGDGLELGNAGVEDVQLLYGFLGILHILLGGLDPSGDPLDISRTTFRPI